MEDEVSEEEREDVVREEGEDEVREEEEERAEFRLNTHLHGRTHIIIT